jgi:hypothetical protein
MPNVAQNPVQRTSRPTIAGQAAGGYPGLSFVSVVPGGGGATGGPLPPIGGTPPPPLEVKAQDDPNLTGFLDRIKNRLDNPRDITRAIESSGSYLRDAAEGERRSLGTRRDIRGVGASGVADYDEAGVQARLQRAQAGNAANISIQRERDEDAVLTGAAGAFAAPGNANRADRSLALQTWTADNAARIARENQQLSAIAAAQQLMQSEVPPIVAPPTRNTYTPTWRDKTYGPTRFG